MKIAAFLLAFASVAFAAGPVTIPKLEVGARTYENATVTLVGPIVALVVHESGAARIPAANLPEDIQRQIGYQPEAAAAATAKIVAEKVATAEKNARITAFATAPIRKFKVIENNKEGLLVLNFEERKEAITIPHSGSPERGIPNVTYQKTYFEITDTQSMIPHTEETKSLIVGQSFSSPALAKGVKRIDASVVVSVYEVGRINKLPR